MNKCWNDEQVNYLKENYLNMSYIEMSNSLHKTPKQIQSKVYILGLSKRKDDWWTNEQISFLKENYDKMNYKDIGLIINKSRSAVQTKLKKLNLSKSDYSNIKRNMNEDYFKYIDDEHKAYWLGFISADGCIYNYSPDSYGFKLELQKSDADILRRFILDIGGDFDVKYSHSLCNNKKYETVKVSFKNKRFVQNLLQYITYNKTDTIRLSNKIPDHLIRHYLRGFSDGDGCFYCGNRSNRKSYEIISNSEYMLKDIQNEFEKNNIHCKIYQKKNGNYKLGIYSFLDIENLQLYLYKDATIFMERKFEKSQKILKLPS